MILLDTHVVAWLYAGEVDRLAPLVTQRLNAEALAISPFVTMELQYLYEVGRVTAPAERVLGELRPRLELTVTDGSTEAVCTVALRLSCTRDPFDRLIAAHAILAELPLVTKNQRLREHLPLAWAS